ncbi:hypothetical protein DLAC_11643 [Tieghemostelium lacteum]|uniref:Transmembrane protein n=1 Tax=Tieghemostelium lacteum TaxID=361077 RepID=A0A151ZHD7_TIELA|nr:hypothetical protein DLAC_11643 [Tieghemostelium lacteum]|eukprot:KYQ93290.1 hypothetical protein DLAC_11643 [Tieghemostelium lacteum]
MGAIGKAKVFLWIFTIVIMFGGSLAVFIINKPLGWANLGKNELAGKVWYNAVIALHAVYIIGVGFELISRAYLVMVGSSCSEQRRGFLCCFVYSMSAWWKLMMILGIITVVITGGLTAIVIVLGGFNSVKDALFKRMAPTVGISLIQTILSIVSFTTSKKLQKIQDEEEEALHGTKKEDLAKSTPTPQPPVKEKEKEKEKESDPSAIVSSA